ncbi:MAG: MFS transporter [Methanocorpusculum sp.]|nr:MFS transporter [Methanocorpusculum sp.]
MDLYTPVLPIILPLLIETMGLSYFLAGLVVTVFNVVSSIAQPLVGIYGDKTGRHADVAFCVLLGSVGISLSALAGNYAVLLALAGGAAIGHALFHPSAMELVHRMSPPAKRGLYNSIFTTSGSISYALGPVIAGVLIAFAGLPAVVWMILPGIIGSAWIFGMSKKAGAYPAPAPKSEAFSPTAAGRMNKDAALVVLVCSLRAWGYIGIITYLPTFLVLGHFGVNAFTASVVVTVMLFSGVAGQIAGGFLSDRFGRKQMLVMGLAVSVPCFLLIFSGGMLMYAGILSYAFFASFCYVTSVTMSQELLPGKAGLASGLTLGFSLGVGGIGAALTGLLADISGSLPSALFWLIIPVAAAPVAAILITYKR